MSQLRNAVASGITHAVMTEAITAEQIKKHLKDNKGKYATAAILAALGGRAYQTKDSPSGIAQSTTRAAKSLWKGATDKDASFKDAVTSTASGAKDKIVRDSKSAYGGLKKFVGLGPKKDDA